MQEYEYEFAEFLYYTPRRLDKEGQLWPIRGGRSTGKPTYKVGPKRIECYSFHLISEGELQFEYEGKRVMLGCGQLFCLFPGVTYHYSIASPQSPLRLSWIAMDGPRVKALLELAGVTQSAPFMKVADPSGLERLLERVYELMQNAGEWTPAGSLELQSLLYGLFSRITPDIPANADNEPASWIKPCIQFMELHASEGVTVQQVASFVGLHRSYFSSVFTREVGISPLNYLQRIRMEKAKTLLRESDATITEIALSLGYPNLFSFTRAFKNYCHIAPVLFRTR